MIFISSLVLCALERVDVLITDERIDERSVAMLEAADVRVVIADSKRAPEHRRPVSTTGDIDVPHSPKEKEGP